MFLSGRNKTKKGGRKKIPPADGWFEEHVFVITSVHHSVTVLKLAPTIQSYLPKKSWSNSFDQNSHTKISRKNYLLPNLSYSLEENKMGAANSNCFGGHDSTHSQPHHFIGIGDESNTASKHIPSKKSYFDFGMKWKKIQPLQVFPPQQQQPHVDEENHNVVVEEDDDCLKSSVRILTNKNSNVTRQPDRLDDIFSRRVSNLSGDVGMPLSGIPSPFPDTSPIAWQHDPQRSPATRSTGTTFGQNTPLVQHNTPTTWDRSVLMDNSLFGDHHGENVHVGGPLKTQETTPLDKGLMKNTNLEISKLLKPILSPSAPFTTPRNFPSQSSEYLNRGSIKNRNLPPRECFSIIIRAEDHMDTTSVEPSTKSNVSNPHQVSYANSMQCLSPKHTSRVQPRASMMMIRMSATDRTHQALLSEALSPGLSSPLFLG